MKSISSPCSAKHPRSRKEGSVKFNKEFGQPFVKLIYIEAGE